MSLHINTYLVNSSSATRTAKPAAAVLEVDNRGSASGSTYMAHLMNGWSACEGKYFKRAVELLRDNLLYKQKRKYLFFMYVPMMKQDKEKQRLFLTWLVVGLQVCNLLSCFSH